METLTKAKLEQMRTQEERINAINQEIDVRQRGLMANGIFPRTFSFMLGKTIILRDIEKDLGIKFQIQEHQEKLSDRFRLFWVDFLINSKIINNMKALKVLERFIKVPSTLFPRWIYEMDGLKIQQDEGDIRMRPILKDYTLLKIWEPNTTKIVKEKVKPGMTCVDLGASIGYFTMQFSRLVGPTGKVYSFEPTEMNYNYLCQNIVLNGFQNIATPFKMAAWDKDEIVKMPMCSPKPIYANGVSVSDHLERLGITKVDFIKLDIDGAEPNAIKGLIKIFENNPQVQMVFEWYPEYIQNAGLNPDDAMIILNKYFTYTIIPDDYSGNCWNLYCVRRKEICQEESKVFKKD